MSTNIIRLDMSSYPSASPSNLSLTVTWSYTLPSCMLNIVYSSTIESSTSCCKSALLRTPYNEPDLFSRLSLFLHMSISRSCSRNA